MSMRPSNFDIQRASDSVSGVVELKPCSCYAIGEAIERDSAKIVDKEG